MVIFADCDETILCSEGILSAYVSHEGMKNDRHERQVAIEKEVF